MPVSVDGRPSMSRSFRSRCAFLRRARALSRVSVAPDPLRSVSPALPGCSDDSRVSGLPSGTGKRLLSTETLPTFVLAKAVRVRVPLRTLLQHRVAQPSYRRGFGQCVRPARHLQGIRERRDEEGAVQWGRQQKTADTNQTRHYGPGLFLNVTPASHI